MEERGIRLGDDYSPLTDIPEGYHNHDYNKQSAEQLLMHFSDTVNANNSLRQEE